jgi:hypothetical protein
MFLLDIFIYFLKVLYLAALYFVTFKGELTRKITFISKKNSLLLFFYRIIYVFTYYSIFLSSNRMEGDSSFILGQYVK